MTTSPALLILELHGPYAALGRSLSSFDSIIAPGNRTASNTTGQTSVTCLDASPIRDSAYGDRHKNPIQTP
jgi:hypothetical protein